jgi:hypothetical protein
MSKPKIMLSYRKFYEDGFNQSFFDRMKDSNAGEFFPHDNVIILSFGEFFKKLMKKYHRTIEKQSCVTISHEMLHYLLYKEHNIKICAKFDALAPKLANYGLY